MSDWSAHLSRGRRYLESLAWFAAAALVVLVMATTAAVAMWLDRRAGSGQADTILIDLPPMEAVAAVADDPGPAPEASAAAPDAPDVEDLNDAPPQPELVQDVTPDTEQPDLPEVEELVEEMPDTTPPPPPEPEVEKAEVPMPKPEKRAERPKREKKREKPAERTAEAQGKKSQASEERRAGGATRQGNNATASQNAKWESRVQSALAKHMRRKSYSHRGTVTLVVEVGASGAVSSASLRGTTGNPTTDAAIQAQARSVRLPATPDGATRRLVVPIAIRR